MRSHKSLKLLLGLVVVTCLTMVWVGCSEDEVVSTQATPGDVTDPEYLVINEQVGTFIDSTIAITKSGLVCISQMVTDTLVDPVNYGPIDPETDSASSVYTGGWHIVYVSQVETAYRIAIRDSVQYRGADGAPQATSSGLASMTYGHQWIFAMSDTTVDYVEFDGEQRFVYTGLNTTSATINGTSEFHVHSKDYSSNPDIWPDRIRDFSFTATATDLVVEQSMSGWSNACPTSGTVTGTIEFVSQDGAGDPTTRTWTFSLVFADGVVTQTIRRGTTYWTSTVEVCIPSSAT